MPIQQHRSRVVCLFLLLALLSFFTVQCGAEEASRPAEVVPATLRWRTWELGSQAEEALMAQFNEQYPQIEFERKDQDESLQALLATSPLPDLLNIDASHEFNALVRQGAVADLTELWDTAGLLAQVPASLQKLTEHEGKQFYIPFGFGWIGMYYNKQVFADYNLQPPQTWAEFITICETLRANGENPLAISGNEPWASYVWFEYLNLRLNGPEFHRGLLTGKEQFDDARVRTVLETWRSLFTNGYYVEKPQALGSLNAVAALVRNERAKVLTREKAVMVLSDTYNVSQLPALFLEELDFFRFPIMDSSWPVVEAVNPFGYAVPSGADHVPQALAFLTHLSTPQAQALIAKESFFSGVTYAPARADVDPALLRADQRRALTLLQETDEAVPTLWLALPRPVWGMMLSEFSRFLREPHDVDIFLQKLEEIRQKAVANGQLSGE